MLKYLSFQTLWLCLAVPLASRSGIAFTAEANQHIIGGKRSFQPRGGSSGTTAVVRNPLSPTGTTDNNNQHNNGMTVPAVAEGSLNSIELGDVDKVSNVFCQ